LHTLDPVIQTSCERLLNARITRTRFVGGGDINQARLIETSKGQVFFLKYNVHDHGAALLETEISGLEAMRATGTLAIPEVIGFSPDPPNPLLLLEYIQENSRSERFWERFGQGLAAMHQHTSEKFGFREDNYIGTFPQSNRYHGSWVDFYRKERLKPQVESALDKGAFSATDVQRFEKLYQELPTLLPEATQPSCIHGDLWSGNFLVGPEETPYLIDPSFSYAHREMDLAMSRLFGGFHPRFYSSYQEVYPLESDWEDRTELYQLYYLLAHVNMFGGSYVNSARRILSKYT